MFTSVRGFEPSFLPTTSIPVKEFVPARSTVQPYADRAEVPPMAELTVCVRDAPSPTIMTLFSTGPSSSRRPAETIRSSTFLTGTDSVFVAVPENSNETASSMEPAPAKE